MRRLFLFWLAIALLPGALAAQAAAGGGSTVQTGDLIRITVWRHPEMSGEFQVSPNGAIADPFYMDVSVAGLPLAEVDARIQEFVRRYESEPRVLVEPLYRVSVGGEVRQPGILTVGPETSVAQAVLLAGGPTPTGRSDRVRLIRGGTVHDVRLDAPGTGLAGSPVMSGDLLIVPRRTSLLRDVVGPISSLMTAIVGITYVATRYF